VTLTRAPAQPAAASAQISAAARLVATKGTTLP
jgi:hypothetical protein